ncbi:uncharacterized protein LOC107429960 [Ziziphus jujuba]|uniref:Uncharacterized protein LOC107429960 n=1 Tax=Ziziphus jujuba TaxID=326968 RepID=A0A6P4AM25_ZIZJJ|nr:uncharacterized protein LOC107429960 [Ziziphus jujuba]
MFKSARWRSEKNRIKAVYKLQFHATQVPQLGVDALAISVIPADVGKPTLKLDKATIQNGTCRWENPVYETVKFFREPRTGKISERIYHFIVSTGSEKAGVLGEISIDFADYAEANKASTISLPLKNSKSNAVLHVLIQRLQANVDQRDVEEFEDIKVKPHERTLRTHLSNGDSDDNIMTDGPINKTSHIAELNGNHRASSGSDITLSSSDSSSGLNTPRENGVRNFNVHQEPSSYLLVPHRPAVYSSTIHEENQGSQWEWSGDSDHGVSTDDSTNDSHNTLLREGSQQASDIEIERLKAELAAYARQVDVSELELQTLRKQIVKESKRGQDLSKEVIGLKEERNALKEECERLKSFKNRIDDAKFRNRLQVEGGDLRSLLEEIRQELNYEKDLNANLRLQLQKTQESNAELMLAVGDLEEMLEQKNGEISNLTESKEDAIESKKTFAKCKKDEDEEQKALEELVKEHRNTNETSLMEQRIIDLYSQIEIYRRDKDELEMQMEQLALDYEILKQENHDISYKLEQSQLQEQLKMQYECSSPLNELESHIENLEKELSMQSKEFSDSLVTIKKLESHSENLEKELSMRSKEFSDSLVTIKELESHIKSLEEELEKQAQGFEADLEALTNAKVEQEQRAIRAEEALRKTRWKNANTAEKLQEEFRRLSMQMASTFDANEKVAMKAMAEAGELRVQKSQLEDTLQKTKEELEGVRDEYEAKLLELSNQIDEKTSQMEQMSLEIANKSEQLEHQMKQKEEITGALSQEILQLKAEIERITAKNNCISELSKQNKNLTAQLEDMESNVKKTEMLLQKGDMERNELVSTIALVKKEAEKSLEELNRLRHLKDEKEAKIELLQSELEKLKTQYDDLKHSLFEDEAEKEKLRKQVFQLKSDLKKKEDALTSIEKKHKDSNGRAAISDGTKTALKNNKSVPVVRGPKEVINLKEKIKLLEGQIKLKEAALETSATSFLQKEKDLQNKIEELESRVEELNQNSAFQQVTPNNDILEEMRSASEHLSTTEFPCKDNGNTISLTKSNEVSEEEGSKASTLDDGNSKHDDLLNELELLKERNNSMECELKEMQQRYSEISLKFAEVEGERQKLVMTVRYLKNSRKN